MIEMRMSRLLETGAGGRVAFNNRTGAAARCPNTWPLPTFFSSTVRSAATFHFVVVAY